MVRALTIEDFLQAKRDLDALPPPLLGVACGWADLAALRRVLRPDDDPQGWLFAVRLYVDKELPPGRVRYFYGQRGLAEVRARYQGEWHSADWGIGYG